MLVAKGRNDAVFARLKEENRAHNVVFYEKLDVKAMLKDIDILVAKPGGAIVSESIAQDVFIAMPAYFFGQERGNMQMVCKNDVGLFESDPHKMIEKIWSKDMASVASRFATIKRNNSAQYIVDTLLSWGK